MGVRVKDEGQFKEIYLKALDSLPVGASVEYAGTTIPDELKGTWLFERGQELSRTEYAKLFSVIGTSYGVGDGSTTFNLPNKCSRAPVGLDENDTDFNTIGKTGGSKYLQEHYHDTIKWYNTSLSADGGSGAHYMNMTVNSGNGNTTQEFHTGNVNSSTQTGNSGNLQPYIVKNFIIKVKETRPLASHTVNAYSESESNAYSCDYMNGALVYSTDEVNTHKKWIDGKDIYRKVYTGTTGTGGSWENISISNLNIDTLIDLKYNFGTLEHYTSGFYINASYNLTVRLNDTDRNIQYQYGTGYSNQDYIIIVEYTKTTQSTRSSNTYSGDIEEKKDIVIDDGNK